MSKLEWPERAILISWRYIIMFEMQFIIHVVLFHIGRIQLIVLIEGRQELDEFWNSFFMIVRLYWLVFYHFPRLCLMDLATKTDIPAGKAYVDHICVLSKFRGKGIGKTLLDMTDMDATKRGCKASISDHLLNLISSNWMYRDLSFSVWILLFCLNVHMILNRLCIFMPPRSEIGGILYLSCLSFCNSVIMSSSLKV